ncbi:MAG: hypothetical protein ACJ8GN_20270 [Longimicrobiaceae bacterium]
MLRRRWMAGAALLLVACAPRPGDPRPTPPVEVRVTNNNRSDVNLYVLRGGTRTRLGTVVAGNTQVLSIRHLPAMGVQQLGFEVQRIGAEGIFSLPRVAVVPGQSVRIRIEDLITTSEISVSEDGS